MHNTKKFPVNSSVSCSLFQKLLVFPKNDPEGVYHARNPEEKGEDDVDEEPEMTYRRLEFGVHIKSLCL